MDISLGLRSILNKALAFFRREKDTSNSSAENFKGCFETKQKNDELKMKFYGKRFTWIGKVDLN